MGLRADAKYIGIVGTGSELIESGRGTLGYQVSIECDDGDTFYVIWLTPKNRDRAKKDFETLGVAAEKLTDERYIQYQLGVDIIGKKIKFGTSAEEYKGKTTIKVAWIGLPGAEGNAPKAMANFFGAKTAESPITDDDIPF